MKELEKLLRESRESTRPDMHPPAGGWNRVQGELKRVPAGPPITGLLTAVALLTLIAGGWYFSLLPGTASEEVGRDREVIKEAEPDSIHMADVLKVEKFQMSTPDSVDAVGQLTAELTSPKEILEENLPTQSPAERKPVFPPKGLKSFSAYDNAAKQTGQIGNRAPERSKELAARNRGSTSAKQPVIRNAMEFGLSGKINSLVSSLDFGATREITSSSENLSSPIVSLDKSMSLPIFEEIRGKPGVRDKWQILFSTSRKFYGNTNFFRSEREYQRLDGPPGDLRFVLPDGEPIYTNSEVSERSYNSILRDYHHRIGIARQGGWGGLLHLSLGYYWHKSRPQNNVSAGLRPDRLRSYRTTREQGITVEFGGQFTFLKRHRFRPYIGASFNTFLYYEGNIDELFIDGLTENTGFVERTFARSVLPLVADFALTGGFQYQIKPRLSVGAFWWTNSGSDVWIDAPFGIQLRHSLK